MIRKIHVNLTIDPEIINWIDTFRGQEPRSRFINYILSLVREKSNAVFNWEEEELKADIDIKKGKIKKFKTVGDALKWLKT